MPSSSPLSISVVIPSYQRAPLLVRAVRSALAQTYAPLEVLVCDDGSSDDGRLRVEALGDARVRWIALPHSGHPAVPRNVGIREARGEWVAFLDNDDVWHRNKLERQSEALAQGFEAVSCNARRVDTEGVAHGLVLVDWSGQAGCKEMLARNCVITSAALVRRSLLLDCGGFPETAALRTWQDYACWLRIAGRTAWVCLPEDLLDYLYAPEQTHSRFALGIEWAQRRAALSDCLRWCLGPGRRPGMAFGAGLAWLGTFKGSAWAWARRYRLLRAAGLWLKARRRGHE